LAVPKIHFNFIFSKNRQEMSFRCHDEFISFRLPRGGDDSLSASVYSSSSRLHQALILRAVRIRASASCWKANGTTSRTCVGTLSGVPCFTNPEYVRGLTYNFDRQRSDTIVSLSHPSCSSRANSKVSEDYGKLTGGEYREDCFV
jgi:hypothetical protein